MSAPQTLIICCTSSPTYAVLASTFTLDGTVRTAVQGPAQDVPCSMIHPVGSNRTRAAPPAGIASSPCETSENGPLEVTIMGLGAALVPSNSVSFTPITPSGLVPLAVPP